MAAGSSNLQDAGDRVREAASHAAQRGRADLSPLLDFQLIKAAGLTITVGGLIGAALVLVITFLASTLVRRALSRFAHNHASANQASLYTVSRLAHYVVLAIGILWAFDVAGVPLGKFSLFAGALGVGLGFGLQAIFSNFISGIILLFDRSLKVGDFVELEGNIRGIVRAINIRATRITTNDNIDVLVPNSEFVSKRVINWTHRSVNRRIRVPFRVSFQVDKELVKKAALEAAARVPFTLATEGEQRPQVWLVDYGENGVDFLLVVWLTEAAARRNVAIQAAYLWELDTSLKVHGIEVPCPQRELRVRSLFGLEGQHALDALERGQQTARIQQPAQTQSPETRDEPLRPLEKHVLSHNDASEDTQRHIVQDEVMREHDEAQARAKKAGARKPAKDEQEGER